MAASAPSTLPSTATTIAAALLLLPINAPLADDYTLAIQPVLSEERTAEVYEPLAAYLSERTGHTITIATSRDFYSYWTRMNRGEFDFIMDAAHFTGYRAKNLDFKVLAAIPDTVSYSLVSGGDDLILSADELVGRPVATIGPPGLGAIRLEQLFDNPMREPLLRTTNSASEAIDLVRGGRAVAAMVPTPMVGEFDDLNTIQVTPSAPHMAISAAPHVPYDAHTVIRGTLIGMSRDKDGSRILDELRIADFIDVNAARYTPYAHLIEGSRVLHATTRETDLTGDNEAAKDVALAEPEE